MQECNNQSAAHCFDTGMHHANARNANNAVNARLRQAGTPMKKHAIYQVPNLRYASRCSVLIHVKRIIADRACVVNRDSRGYDAQARAEPNVSSEGLVFVYELCCLSCPLMCIAFLVSCRVGSFRTTEFMQQGWRLDWPPPQTKPPLPFKYKPLVLLCSVCSTDSIAGFLQEGTRKGHSREHFKGAVC